MRKPSSGFTLIEIMVVLVILGIMAALVLPNIIGRADEGRTTAAKADVATIMSALKLYRLDNARYPTAAQGLSALSVKPSIAPIPNNYKTGGYLEKLPQDPWGNEYQYQNPGKYGEIDVYSLGPDGSTSAGINSPKVIGSWQ